ncbi:Biopolymer transport protein ExbD/TolR [Leptothrix cholodnii SP-6]|uniref:Biopolymer transport protein ExbD/TolR n=1 Tax=Leptothrix cholodnii (strain ATCC 51168 / LMG 8142 / SP-6) TaxID=395495 RepID=B1Y6I3_LEPCP|nr:biopolymer transporter ExbD [Leptothrix cholodnii]ACB34819.1 Biopolymer transport protein ExbD/TolR [Leptothrix cholodnii SP-6]
MNFRPRRPEEPEINLIPFIDVLLVVLIFLMLSTTYSRFTELKVTLPVADANQLDNPPREILVAVSAEGRYSVNRQLVGQPGVEGLTAALSNAAQGDFKRPLIISADAMAAHQSVINVMDAARRVGLSQLTFAAQNSRSPAR